MAARLIQLSIKPGVPEEPGLPKHAVPRLRVTLDGAAGDYNDYRTRKLAGDPDQAILLLTEEVLLSLQAEGWPVGPGDFGENLTLGGIPEASLVPGTVITAGAVRLEVTKRCDPCRTLHSLPYVGRDRGAAFLRATRLRRGWYARVLSPGEILLGDPLGIEPQVAAR